MRDTIPFMNLLYRIKEFVDLDILKSEICYKYLNIKTARIQLQIRLGLLREQTTYQSKFVMNKIIIIICIDTKEHKPDISKKISRTL